MEFVIIVILLFVLVHHFRESSKRTTLARIKLDQARAEFWARLSDQKAEEARKPS